MHNAANLEPKAHFLFRLIFISEFVTIWGVIMGMSPRLKMTKCDMGGGGQISIF